MISARYTVDLDSEQGRILETMAVNLINNPPSSLSRLLSLTSISTRSRSVRPTRCTKHRRKQLTPSRNDNRDTPMLAPVSAQVT
jgi:hypothetical protein